MEYCVNDRTISYQPENARQWGDNVVLLHHANDLTNNTAMASSGYTIEKLFDAPLADIFQAACRSLLQRCWRKAGIVIPDNFVLDQYHTLVQDFTSHLAAVEHTKLIEVSDFPVPIAFLETRVSEVVGKKLRVRNPFDNQSIFHFRVVRPNSTDNNPLHRDIWLEDYDNCINLYIPIAGSNEKSSLIIVPGSHHWSESKIERTIGGAIMNGMKFNVPAVTAIDGNFDVVRPDPQLNEVLIFSPYLIHGGAVNLQADRTRISLEIRLWEH
ncbi:phytanoyl-CoA dioxygenase family protein [Pseudochryseolinea flava]|uniref:Phytanoyl-CoA dioxygenase n=1 Tax=Pseudochryseolinea flava TaxID=2059302 RepID=A0A364XYN0_9BACT|nr:hypothetical protein [Pseudochryseolinea flava]RAV99095.1 hypothetical protein DQQ10_21100 [Pseudochryseolinea flava]